MDWWTRFRSFLVQTQRVLRVTRKPSRYEFTTIVKITGLGILAIGALGFLLHIGYQLLRG